MAKRYIDSEIFGDAWFMDLPNKYKLFWIYLITSCDYCGIWEVNYKLARFYVGESLEPVECERTFKDRIVKIEDGKYWFIPKYIYFQNGYELRKSNPAVKRVIERLEFLELFQYLPKTKVLEGTTEGLKSTLEGGKGKGKEKGEGKGIYKGKEKGELFNVFWKEYPKKIDKKETRDLFIKKNIRRELLKEILTGLSRLKKSEQWTKEEGKFIPSPARWLRKEKWKDELVAPSVKSTNTFIPLSQRMD